MLFCFFHAYCYHSLIPSCPYPIPHCLSQFSMLQLNFTCSFVYDCLHVWSPSSLICPPAPSSLTCPPASPLFATLPSRVPYILPPPTFSLTYLPPSNPSPFTPPPCPLSTPQDPSLSLLNNLWPLRHLYRLFIFFTAIFVGFHASHSSRFCPFCLIV